MPSLLKVAYFLKLTDNDFQGHLLGYFTEYKRSGFSKKSYFNHNFQEDFENWLNSDISLRGYYIRLYNQIQFSLFKKGNDIIGKNNNIFQIGYINAECGLEPHYDFRIPENYENLKDYVTHLESIQRKLLTLGKNFIFFITLSKAAQNYYDIPLKYRLKRDADFKPPYFYLKELLKSKDINVLDARDFFSTDGTPNFYPSGIHWAKPIEQRMSKLIIEKMEQLSGKKFPEIMLHELQSSPKPFWRDADVYDLQNILEKPRNMYFQYDTSFSSDWNSVPKYLLQGGSFSEGFYFKDYADFSKESLSIFYNLRIRNDIHDYIGQNFSAWSDIDFTNILDSVDFVIIELNEAVIPNFSNGFAAYFDSFLDSYISQEQGSR